MATKYPYLDETLKRLPLYILCGTFGWYILSTLFEIKADVKEMKMMTFKDKETIDSKLNDVQLLIQNNSNRTTEIEKGFIKIEAILNNYKLEIKNED